MELYNVYKNGVLSFMGPINIHVRVFFGNYLKIILQDDYQTINRIYKTFIELTQNVDYYSAEFLHSGDKQAKTGIGSFILKEYKDYFNFTTGNLIYRQHGEKLKQYCNEINESDNDVLREIKRKTRKLAGIRESGAHIGLLQVGVITGNLFKYDIRKIDDTFSYFTLTVQIDKYSNSK